MKESNQPETNTNPRRHPTSRGMRKHVRKLKRLGLVENHQRRKAREFREVWLARNPETVPISPSSRAPYTPSPPPPRNTGDTIRKLWVADLPFAKSPENLCPELGCGHLSQGRYETVLDIESQSHIQVRRCSSCSNLYRDFAVTYSALHVATDINQTCPYCQCPHPGNTGQDVVTTDKGRQRVIICSRRACQKVFRLFEPITFAKLLTARDTWNDCPHSDCSGYALGGKHARHTIITGDAGRQEVCLCDGMTPHYYKPYAAPVRSGGWD